MFAPGQPAARASQLVLLRQRLERCAGACRGSSHRGRSFSSPLLKWNISNILQVRGNAIVYQTLINACLEADEWDRVRALPLFRA